MSDYCQGHIHSVSDRDLHDYLDIYLDPILLIVIFILGYIISNLISKNQEKRKLIRIYDYFLIYWRNQKKSIIKQREFIDDQTTRVNNLQGLGGTHISINTQPYFILDTINKEDLFSSWVDINKKSPQDLMDILKFINFTQVAFEKYVEYHNHFSKRQDEMRIKWNDNISHFHTLKAQIFLIPKDQSENDQDRVYLNDIYNKWIESGMNKSLESVIEGIVTPLLNYFNPIYSKNPNNHLALSIIHGVQQIQITYKEWKGEKENYLKYLANLKTTLDEQLLKISNIV